MLLPPTGNTEFLGGGDMLPSTSAGNPAVLGVPIALPIGFGPFPPSVPVVSAFLAPVPGAAKP